MCAVANGFNFLMFSWSLLHSFVCVHSWVIISCLSRLEMVSLIPLHHMSGFICILCQELMEFFFTARSGSLWRHQTWCDVYTAASAIASDWFVVLLFALWLFLFLSIFVIFSQIWMNFWMKYYVSFFVVVLWACFRGIDYTSLHPSNTIHTFLLLLLFFLKWNGEEMVP